MAELLRSRGDCSGASRPSPWALSLFDLWKSLRSFWGRGKGHGAANKDALRIASARVSGASVGPAAGAELPRTASTSLPHSRHPQPQLMCREKLDIMILTRKLDLCLAVGPAAGASCGGDSPRRKCHPALSSRCLSFCAFKRLSEEARDRVTQVSRSGGGGVWEK